MAMTVSLHNRPTQIPILSNCWKPNFISYFYFKFCIIFLLILLEINSLEFFLLAPPLFWLYVFLIARLSKIWSSTIYKKIHFLLIKVN